MRKGTVSGAVSLVMIFCVLCMAVFSVLTFATAQREERLAKLNEERARAYYEADAKAIEVINALKNGEEPEVDVAYETENGVRIMEFEIPAGGDLALSVRASIENGEVTIYRWQTLFEGEWEMDESFQVWDGVTF